MAASMLHPVYTAKLVKESSTKTTTYTLKNITTDLVISQQKNEIAEKATLNLMNIQSGTSLLSDIISVMDKIYIYADTGSGTSEVFRGIVWERGIPEDADSEEVRMICYDKSIYLHKSKDNLFVKKGKQTKAVIASLASKWGFKISYKYASISHAKLVFQNQYIADIMISLLNEIKKKTGKGYVIYLEKDTIVIDYEGSNSTVYKIAKGQNAIRCSYVETMEDVVTKVEIVKAETVSKDGSDTESGKYLTVTSVSKNTSKYGTLQEIIVKGKDDKLADVKKEANEILKEKAAPKVDSDVESIDIPWVKKGHRIYIQTKTMNGYYIAKSVEHDAASNVMSLEVEKYE